METKEVNINEVIHKVKESNSLVKIEQEYKNKIQELKKVSPYTKYGIFGAIILSILALTGLVAGQIISGSIALLVAGIVGVISFYGIMMIKKFDPVIRKKIANKQINMLIEEAQTKKIETLANYLKALEVYHSYSKSLRNKVDSLLEKYKNKLENTEDKYLIEEYKKMIAKMEKMKEAIEIIVSKSKEKKEQFVKYLKLAQEKQQFINETKDIVNFLENNSNDSIDKFLVDESLNSLEMEFLEITNTIENLSKDLE